MGVIVLDVFLLRCSKLVSVFCLLRCSFFLNFSLPAGCYLHSTPIKNPVKRAMWTKKVEKISYFEKVKEFKVAPLES